MKIEITDADLKNSSAEPWKDDAIYFVAFTRNFEDDYIDDRDDDRAGMEQLHAEIQEAFDAGETSLAGTFKIIGRVFNDQYTRLIDT